MRKRNKKHNTIKVHVKRYFEDSKLPTRADSGSAGWDLYAYEDADILPGNTQMIASGIAVAIPNGYFGAIYNRSGLSTKHGIRLANCTAVIDSSYRGMVGIPLHNDTDRLYKVAKGDRVAQMIIQPVPEVKWEEVDELDDTERSSGGFGHSGR